MHFAIDRAGHGLEPHDIGIGGIVEKVVLAAARHAPQHAIHERPALRVGVARRGLEQLGQRAWNAIGRRGIGHGLAEEAAVEARVLGRRAVGEQRAGALAPAIEPAHNSGSWAAARRASGAEAGSEPGR